MKKIIIQNKKVLSVFIILIMIIFFKTSFLKNLMNVINFNESERISKIYGFCESESIGYLKYLKKKYKFKGNPEIVNYEHNPKSKWSIYETDDLNTNNGQMIILNYPPRETDLALANDLSTWIELAHYKDNFYELTDAFYYTSLYKTIEKIHIKGFNETIVNLKFHIKDEAEKFEIVKNLQKVKSDIDKNFILNQKLNIFEVRGKRFFFEFNNIREEEKIFITLKPKHDLNDFTIIDKSKNCYFVE